ncbi:MAG: GNAT family N-acetyltransferase, partial [Marinobacter sp.]|nr:GNAT family N-acetyltransferase [Marinobacter sp.]
MEPADLAEVLDIELCSYSHPWSEAVFRDCFRPDYRLWGSFSGGDLGGYAVVAYLFDEAHLLNLCVAPGFRRQGVGRYLLRHLITQPEKAASLAGLEPGDKILEIETSTLGVGDQAVSALVKEIQNSSDE